MNNHGMELRVQWVQVFRIWHTVPYII